MILVPDRNFLLAAAVHDISTMTAPGSVTCNLNVLCDWIEASVLFQAGELSQVDVIDVLMEEEIYADQNEALNVVHEAWLELERRERLCRGSYGLEIERNWLKLVTSWEERAAHAFCLVLSLATCYRWWSREFGQDYTEQGELFELLTEQALFALSQPIWKLFRAGWSKSNLIEIRQVVHEVSSRIGTSIGNVDSWESPNAKDIGLDLLWDMPFLDGPGGIPHYLIQCASGQNWREKLGSPNLHIWRDLLAAPFEPTRGIAVPFCFADNREFRNHCVGIGGLFIERCRLLGAGRSGADWVDPVLKERIVHWTQPRVEKLLERSQ